MRTGRRRKTEPELLENLSVKNGYGGPDSLSAGQFETKMITYTIEWGLNTLYFIVHPTVPGKYKKASL